jgi:hypothetical protein
MHVHAAHLACSPDRSPPQVGRTLLRRHVSYPAPAPAPVGVFGKKSPPPLLAPAPMRYSPTSPPCEMQRFINRQMAPTMLSAPPERFVL